MELQEKVLSECLQHAQQVLKGDLKVDILETSEGWDETLQRNVFEQSMMVKLELHEFEIITDKYGMLAGYIDHAQWQDCYFQPVTAERILTSAHKAGWVPVTARAESESFEGSKGEAVIKLSFGALPAGSQFLVGFNPASNKIIYLVPDRLSPYDSE